MVFRDAMAPTTALYRIGRAPHPLALPRWPYTGGNRFDDPYRRFRVLYAAEERLTCFLETLAQFRPAVEILADEPDFESGFEPVDWVANRLIGQLRLQTGHRWLDLRARETRQELRQELAATLRDRSRYDFDAGDALTRDRTITQAIAAWAYSRGYRGIAYACRFDPSLSSWAVFCEDTSISAGTSYAAYYSPVNTAPIAANDPDLMTTNALFRL